ncbi:MAG: hypothetical protein EZS28_039386 [Streblomastix strix]|uniref:Uncharacterized protein n=1 Tax=Streblomastix strix TaxID=222440 RepID=A0A5J4U3B7_9EUKA|nr:MAG: hypothetical protein EZS28_039386 [Streblomastix strix]
MKIGKEIIVPLIHLNCPTNINCQQYINIPQSPALKELKSAVYQTLNEIPQNNQGFKEILVNDHNIIPHLTHPLIYNDNKCKKVINTPKVLLSLTTLSIYKIGTHFSYENDQLTLEVRDSSIRCLWHIQYYGDASVQSELVNANYIGVLVIAISTASGSGEEKDNEIYKGLDYIYRFLYKLNNGRNYNETFPPQPLLAHRSYEQIEEEGANEEIESQQINKGFNGDIKIGVNLVKGLILNIFIEQGNPKPDWCNW